MGRLWIETFGIRNRTQGDDMLEQFRREKLQQSILPLTYLRPGLCFWLAGFTPPSELDAASELRLLRLRGGLPMRDSESIFKAMMLQVPGLADEKRQ